MQPDRARTSGLGVPLLPLARWVGWVAPVRPTHGVLVLSCPSAALRVCSVLGRLAPVHLCARAVCSVASAVSWATWLLFTGVLARCVVLRVRCPLLLPFFLLFPPFFFFFITGAARVRRFCCCAWVWVCAGAGAGPGVDVLGNGGRVAVALWVPCVCAGPQASGFQGAGPGGC